MVVKLAALKVVCSVEKMAVEKVVQLADELDAVTVVKKVEMMVECWAG